MLYFLSSYRRIVDEIMRELAASESPVAVVEAAELTALISACYDRSIHDKRQPPPHADNFPHIIYPGEYNAVFSSSILC